MQYSNCTSYWAAVAGGQTVVKGYSYSKAEHRGPSFWAPGTGNEYDMLSILLAARNFSLHKFRLLSGSNAAI